jgi:hypothetical protein
MSKASDFKYKWHDDDRPLGPPHQRFPDMHPEDDVPVKNEVFLEIPTASIAGVWLSTLAALFMYVAVICIFVVAIARDVWSAFTDSGFLFLLETGILCILLSLLARPPLPYRLNRITREVIISNGEQVARIPWEKVPARISKTLNPRGACFNYCLQFGFGPTPEEVRVWSYIDGYGRYEERALRCWEYFCRYMESPDGHVALRKTSEHEKSDDRRMWEADHASEFTKTLFLFIAPMAWMDVKITSLNKRKHKPWPQEALDICENHPLLQGKKSPPPCR